MSETLDNLSMLSNKIKDMHLDVIRNENKIVEENRKMEGLMTRMKQLEGMYSKSLNLDDLINSTEPLDAKTIIDTVVNITQEI